MANNIATIYNIHSKAPGRSGYRWMLKTQRFTMTSNKPFATKGNCKRSLLRFIAKHKFDLWDIKYEEKERMAKKFLV